MVMERTAGMDHERQLDRELNDVDNGSILPSSLRKIFLELDPNPPLPAGWEKCLDLQSGSIYFKDRISGTSTYKDPRKKQASALSSFFVGGLSALTEPSFTGRKHSRDSSVTLEEKLARWNSFGSNSGSEDVTNLDLSFKVDSGATAWARKDEGESQEVTALPSETEGISSSVEETSVCTVEKVKDALKRSHYRALSRNDSGCTNSSLSSLHALSLNLPSPSSPSLRACRSFRSYASSNSSSSHSGMSFQGGELEELKEEASSCEETLASDSVNQSVRRHDDKLGLMVTFGCRRCLMYIMLPKANPCCPKCGSSELLEIFAPSSPKRQKVE